MDSRSQRTTGEDADWRLVGLIKAGDDTAFNVLMQRYKRPVLNFIFRMVGNAAEAEDVAQDVFVRAYRGILKDGFHAGSARFSTWLFLIARRAALDWARWKRRHPARSLSEMAAEGEALRSHFPTSAEIAAANDTADRIAAAVMELPEEQRVAIAMSEYEGCSHAEIAAVLSCSEKAVESRLYRARQFLRHRLADLLG